MSRRKKTCKMDDLTFIHPTRQGKMDEDEKNYLVDDLTSIYPPRQRKKMTMKKRRKKLPNG